MSQRGCLLLPLLLGLAVLRESSTSGDTVREGESSREVPHHRQKRVFWFTNDGRIALPPGTVMTITPTLALPFVRNPPYGFLSNMTISLPFTSESVHHVGDPRGCRDYRIKKIVMLESRASSSQSTSTSWA